MDAFTLSTQVTNGNHLYKKKMIILLIIYPITNSNRFIKKCFKLTMYKLNKYVYKHLKTNYNRMV